MCAGTTRTPASAKGSKVGDLMVEGTYIFDCEVFAYDWLFDFKDVVTGEHISIWNDNDAVIAFMERDPFLGGFNNKHYDNFILKAVMCGFTPEEVKKVNDLIIQEELSGWDIPSLKEYRVFFDSFDLRDDCQDGISLKAIEAHLGIPIEETGVDFNIDRPLTESERRRTEYYCRYDVDATEILWKLRQGYLDNKVAVGAKRGLTDRKAMYMTNAKLTSVYLQAEKPEKPWTDERNYQYPDKLLRQYIPQEIFDFFDRLHDPNVPDIDLFGGYDQYGRKIKGASIEFRIGDCVCTIAYGGIVAECPTLKIIQLNTDGIMVSFDKSDEAKWQEITQEWQDRTGFELEEDFIQKIVQRDVNNYVEVPVGDGKPKVKGGNLVRGILTNANIDFTTMGLPAWDNMSGGAWNINNNACIVATAMKEYFVNGTLPEETIAASNNILDFQVIAKVGGKYSGCYQLIGGEKVPVQKVNRVYACKNKGYGKIYKTHATTGKDAKVPSLPDHCIVDNNNELSIDVVDREWYVKLAKEQIRKFLGVKAPRKNTRKINSLRLHYKPMPRTVAGACG